MNDTVMSLLRTNYPVHVRGRVFFSGVPGSEPVTPLCAKVLIEALHKSDRGCPSSQPVSITFNHFVLRISFECGSAILLFPALRRPTGLMN
ncbi:hypothetical protein [Paraburkholderia terricola]|uniref:hypothetical protein n=1 Tax=Paraburkholderia terricola TaxID=169427 RepID=UPI001FD1BEFD|nr:hypothetical protein [Paraburkholderia terricola]